MTEVEWQTAEPLPLLNFISEKVSARKLRLFAVALSFRHLEILTDTETPRIIEVAESYADGMVTEQEMRRSNDKACWLARSITGLPEMNNFQVAQAVAAWEVANLHTAVPSLEWICDRSRMSCSVSSQAFVPSDDDTEAIREVDRQEKISQSKAIRDIFGNPFRPVAFAPAWRTSTAVALAEGIYADRAFDRLPILADALQDAGCEDADLLGHLRGDGPHVRGCWALDLVLGKE